MINGKFNIKIRFLIGDSHSVHVVTSGGNMEKDFLSAGAQLLNLISS